MFKNTMLITKSKNIENQKKNQIAGEHFEYKHLYFNDSNILMIRYFYKD